MPSSSETGICAEASPVIAPRNQNTGQTVEASCQCPPSNPGASADSVNLHEELKETFNRSKQEAGEHCTKTKLEQSAQLELCKAKLELSASEERHLLAVMKLREEHHMDSLGVLGIMAGEIEKEKASHGDEMRRVESHNLALKEQEKAQNQELQTEQEKLLAQREDVSSQLQEVNQTNSQLLEQLTERGQEKDKLQQELEETWKTADKRKAMLDELAIDVAQEKLRHKEELQAQIQSMEGTKGWFERRLKEAEETAEKSALEHQEQVEFHRVTM
ncbi:hypothetical protein AAFF_G00185310 [Aldrovandia affinis]|uniref:Uncharacterized protein n=1 Tax=Aldrovandia affinis TaxID=143900 RepID=A0AAD7RK29_9TELE|nr:hypothetical protein AAFF_G00185310 [Aldrovandia affinis]